MSRRSSYQLERRPTLNPHLRCRASSSVARFKPAHTRVPAPPRTVLQHGGRSAACSAADAGRSRRRRHASSLSPGGRGRSGGRACQQGSGTRCGEGQGEKASRESQAPPACNMSADPPSPLADPHLRFAPTPVSRPRPAPHLPPRPVHLPPLPIRGRRALWRAPRRLTSPRSRRRSGRA